MVEKYEFVVEQLSRINPYSGAENLPDPPRPDEDKIPKSGPIEEQIVAVQEQLNILTYNHLPNTFFNLEKHRPLQNVLLTAKDIMTEALPIRCLEATFVGLYLTQSIRGVSRIPLSFRSTANNALFRHIVLVIQIKGPRPVYGALGLSRKPTLMYKPMRYNSIYDLLMDYKKEYEALGHRLLDIKIGLALSHDSHHRFLPCWRYVALRMDPMLGAPSTGTRCPDEEAELDASHSQSQLRSSPLLSTSPAADGMEDAKLPRGVARRQSAASFKNALEEFLYNYARLLPTISEQYHKGLNVLEGASKPVRLCFMDLDLAERDAGMENERRVQLIAANASPLSMEARKAASTRTLPSSLRKERSKSVKRPRNAKRPVGVPLAKALLPEPVSKTTAAPPAETAQARYEGRRQMLEDEAVEEERRNSVASLAEVPPLGLRAVTPASLATPTALFTAAECVGGFPAMIPPTPRNHLDSSSTRSASSSRTCSDV